MLIISDEQVKALRERLGNSLELESYKTEVQKMLEIKSTLLWRADVGSGCVGSSISRHLEGEVKLLENTLSALEEGDVAEGISSLIEYEKLIH